MAEHTNCTCIADIDAKLGPDHSLNTTLSFREGEVSRPLIGLIRKDKWTLETRRGKRSSFLCSYCPFCGVKYEEAAIAKSSPLTGEG